MCAFSCPSGVTACMGHNKEVVSMTKSTKKLISCISAVAVMMSLMTPAYAEAVDTGIYIGTVGEDTDGTAAVVSENEETDGYISPTDIPSEADETPDDPVSEEQTSDECGDDLSETDENDITTETPTEEEAAEQASDGISDVSVMTIQDAVTSEKTGDTDDISEPDDAHMTIDEAYEIVNSIDEEDYDGFEPYGIALTEEQSEAVSRIIYYDRTGDEDMPDEGYAVASLRHYGSHADGSSDYYYSQMNAVQKDAYDRMAAACDEFLSSGQDISSQYFAEVRFASPLSQTEAYNLYWGFFYSNPQYFFLRNTFSYSYNSAGLTKFTLLCYDNCWSGSSRQTLWTGIKNKTDAWISDAAVYDTLVEKETFLAQKISENVDYQFSDYNQSMMGSVYFGESVCMGYAFAFEYLCNRIGVDSFILSCSESQTDQNAHAWNAVKLYGEWYLADPTFCDMRYYLNGQLTSRFDERYLNKSKATFLINDMDLNSRDSHPMYNYQFDYSQFTMPAFDKDFTGQGSEWFSWDSETGTLKLSGKLPDTSYGNGLADLAEINKSSIKKIEILSGTEAGVSICGAFGGLASLETIEGLDDLDIGSVTDMSYLFHDCSSLGSLDLTGLDIGTSVRTQGFFSGCSSLTSLVLPSGFAVTEDMELENNGGIYLGWAADGSSAVISGNGTYAEFTSASEGVYVRTLRWYEYSSGVLTLSGQLPDTSEGSDLATLAGVDRTAVRKIVISGAKAGTSLDSAFSGMTSLTEIEGLAQLDMTDVADMDDAFSGCSSLTSLDLSGVDMSVSAQGIFSGCSLTSVILREGTVVTADAALVNKDDTYSGWALSGTDTVISGDGGYAMFTAARGGKYVRIRNITYTKHDAVPASCTRTGYIEYYTGSDGNLYVYTDGEYLQISESDTIAPKTAHTKGSDVVENYVAATYERNGSFDNVVYCTECGAEISRKTVIIPMYVLDKPVFTTAAGSGSVTVSWSAVNEAKAYRVYRYENGAFKCLKEITGLSYTDTGLTNGKKYGYLVRAFNGSTGSAYTTSDIVYATPVSSVTSLEKPVFTVTAGNGYATIKWSAVDGAASYRVYSYDGAFKCLKEITGTSYTAADLTNGKRIGFLVRAFDGNVGSPYTTADIVYTTPFGVLAKPSFTLTAGNRQVSIKWNAVSGATSYRVYRVDNGKYVYLCEITGTSYTATGLTNGTKYGFLVRAFNGSTGSAYSSADIVYTTPVGSLAKPSVTAVAGSSAVTLRWGAVSGASTYRIYRYDSGKYTALANTSATSYTVSGLSNGTRYGFMVRALNGSIGSPYTAADVVYATPVASVGKPSVTAVSGNTVADVTWSSVKGATSYRIYVYYPETKTYQFLSETSFVGTVHVSKLINGRTYGFLIRAFNGSNGSPYTLADVVMVTPHA